MKIPAYKTESGYNVKINNIFVEIDEKNEFIQLKTQKDWEETIKQTELTRRITNAQIEKIEACAKIPLLNNIPIEFRELNAKEILEESFVFVKDVAQALQTALITGKNVLLYGPGGHAKSEMVNLLIQKLGLENDTFYQFFGEGMSEDRLFGQIDLEALETEKKIRYNTNESFLTKKYAVFEELFDAPSKVLTALKDTLTRKIMVNGAQQIPMKTKTIIALTNVDPKEIETLGASYKALLERFPIQVKVDWASYRPEAYEAMLQKVIKKKNTFGVTIPTNIYAEALAISNTKGNFISPRTAVHGLDILIASAQANGRTIPEKEDYELLRFLDADTQILTKTCQELLEAQQEELRAIAELKNVEKEMQQIMKTNTKFKEAGLRTLFDKLQKVRIPDNLYGTKVILEKALREIILKVKENAGSEKNIRGLLAA